MWLSSQSRVPRGLTQVLCLTVTFFVSPTLGSIVLPLNWTTYDVCHDQDSINSMQMPSDSEVLDPPSSLHGTRSYRVMPHTQVPTRISICLSDPVRVLAQTPTCDLAIMASIRSYWYSNSTYSPRVHRPLRREPPHGNLRHQPAHGDGLLQHTIRRSGIRVAHSNRLHHRVPRIWKEATMAVDRCALEWPGSVSVLDFKAVHDVGLVKTLWLYICVYTHLDFLCFLRSTYLAFVLL